MNQCKSVGCNKQTKDNEDFCSSCSLVRNSMAISQTSLSKQYPKYYKDVGDFSEIDVYTVHKLFNIQDPSGCIQHASKKLLLSGVRTGGKSFYKDVREARDTLERWLQLNADADSN